MSLSDSKIRGKKIKEDLVRKCGGLVAPDQLGVVIGNENARRALQKDLIVINQGGQDYLPKIQFTNTGVVPGLSSVIRAFDLPVSGWGLLSFFLSPLDDLSSGCAMDLLINGEQDKVIEMASRFCEHGAP